MKAQIPFTDYDFYAYLTPGLVFLVSFYTATQWAGFRLTDEVAVSVSGLSALGASVALGVFAYILGQIFASTSGLLVENRLVRLLCRYHPLDVLLAQEGTPEHQLKRFWAGRTYRPLAPEVQAAIYNRLRARYGEVLGLQPDLRPRVAYEFVYATVRRLTDTAARLDYSRNQYAFARNMCLSASMAALSFFGAALFAVFSHAGDPWAPPACAGFISVGVAVGMFVRFIKFYGTFYQQALRAYIGPLSLGEGRAQLGGSMDLED